MNKVTNNYRSLIEQILNLIIKVVKKVTILFVIKFKALDFFVMLCCTEISSALVCNLVFARTRVLCAEVKCVCVGVSFSYTNILHTAPTLIQVAEWVNRCTAKISPA